MCFDSVYKSVCNISHSKKNRERYDEKFLRILTESTRYSCQILTKFEFSLQTFEKNNTRITNLMTNRPVGVELFHADRRTDMTKLTVAFHKLENVPKNVSLV